MPNQKGGKKFKKGKKNNNYEKKLIFKSSEDNQEYAKILKVYGSGRYQVSCFDGNERLGICAGTIKRKFRFNIDDIVFYIEFDVIKAIPLCGIVDLEHQIIKYCCAGSEGVDMIFYYVLG